MIYYNGDLKHYMITARAEDGDIVEVIYNIPFIVSYASPVLNQSDRLATLINPYLNLKEFTKLPADARYDTLADMIGSLVLRVAALICLHEDAAAQETLRYMLSEYTFVDGDQKKLPENDTKNIIKSFVSEFTEECLNNLLDKLKELKLIS